MCDVFNLLSLCGHFYFIMHLFLSLCFSLIKNSKLKFKYHITLLINLTIWSTPTPIAQLDCYPFIFIFIFIEKKKKTLLQKLFKINFDGQFLRQKTELGLMWLKGIIKA